MESYLTKVSYLAGQMAAKDMNLSAHDAHLWAERVAGSTQSMYDHATRTLALDSNLMRAWKPMQTYVFDAASGVLDTFNLTGIDKPGIMRAREIMRFLIGARLMQWLWSVIFGQDWKEAIYNPRHAKTTVGSNIPLFGQEVDIKVSQWLPWIDDQSWKETNAAAQFGSATRRLIRSAARGDDNIGRESLIYAMRYIAPWAGIPGSIPMENFTRMSHAVLFADGMFENIDGSKLDEFVGDGIFRNYANPVWWMWGVAHGRKAMKRRDSERK
jgi:hypothetical protein